MRETFWDRSNANSERSKKMEQDMSATHISESLSLKKMVSFTLPIVVLTISTQVITYYLMFFYTDVALLPVKAISMIFLVCRFYDAINDVCFGYLMNKTRSRHGLYRPYILWTAIPLAITSVFLFWVPDFSDTAKIVYVIAVYFIWNAVASLLSVAMNAIFPLVATNETDRVKINSFRIGITTLCILLVSTYAMPLVNFFGGGNMRTGFVLTMLLFSLIGLPLQLLGFRSIKEKKHVEQKSVSLIGSASMIFRDKGLVAITLMYTFFWIASTFRSSSIVHYITYVLKKPEFIPTFILVTLGVPILMQFSFRYLVKIIKPSVLMIIGLLGSVIGNILIFMSGDNLPMLIVSNIIFGMSIAMPANLVFILYARQVDKLSEKHNVNLSSIVFSIMSFVSKIGIGIGGAGVAFVLGYVNFIPNTEQTQLAASGITFNLVGGNIIGLALAFVCLLFYIKFEKNVNVVQE